MAAGACCRRRPRRCTADVLAVFGREVGDVVTPTTGLNEFASALVAAIQLGDALDREQRIAIAACIEQTIPFRTDPVQRAARAARAARRRPARARRDASRARCALGNRDVENFADNDPARFLDNTWKLLPESNPALHSPMVYTVRDYRIALQKMEGFLAWLPADRVFHAWGDEPKPEIHARRVARTTGNLELAVRYLRAKLYSIALVEAIAEVTGGDVPLDYFMGGLKSRRAPPTMQRIEQLPAAAARTRAISIRRCTGCSPRAARRSRASTPGRRRSARSSTPTVGEAAVMKGVELRQEVVGRRVDARASSSRASRPGRSPRSRAPPRNIIETRRDRLFALAERLER